MINYYGRETPEQILRYIGEICDVFSDGYPDKADLYARSYRMLYETICAETQFGTFPDYCNESGFGLPQFDVAGYNEVMRKKDKYQDLIWEKWKINIDLVQLIELRYNPFLSLLFCRLFYKGIPQHIPHEMPERAHYWKRWYNTSKGKGTVEHYIKSVESVDKMLDKQGNIA
jgi:hypothetical protein